jgi:hypothetical protein
MSDRYADRMGGHGELRVTGGGMADRTAHIHTNKVLPQIMMKVVVHDPPIWRARLWLAMRLMRLAAVVLNCNIEIETEPRRA